MNLSSQYADSRCTISFELFPPKTPKGFESLIENVKELLEFEPSFFTCTYGAGGSTRGTTLDVVEKVKEVTGLPVAAHLTCVGSTVEELCDFLDEAKQRGVDYIVALRGDPPKGTEKFEAVEGGLHYANELVDLIQQRFNNFGIAVAGYPEVHQEAASAQADLDNLKRKVDAGADVIITQLFYDNADFYRFRDDCESAGLDVPIVPGILPVTNFKQATRIASMCKARIPKDLEEAMTAKEEDADAQFNVGVDHARRQTIDLLEHGVPGIHYYVLNKSAAAKQLLTGIQLVG